MKPKDVAIASATGSLTTALALLVGWSGYGWSFETTFAAIAALILAVALVMTGLRTDD